MAQAAGVVAEAKLDSASLALRLAGEEGLRALISSWPEADRHRLTYGPRPADSAGTGGVQASKFPDYKRIASLPGGEEILLRYDASGVIPRHKRPDLSASRRNC